MESLQKFIVKKAEVTEYYKAFCRKNSISFVEGMKERAPLWLNSVLAVQKTNATIVEIYERKRHYGSADLASIIPSRYMSTANGLTENSKWLEDRVINIPSSVPLDKAGAQK